MANPEDIFKARIKASTEHPLVWEVMLLMPGARALTPAQAPPSLPVELHAGMLGPLSLSSHPGVQGWGRRCWGQLFSLLLFRFRWLATSSVLSVYSLDLLGLSRAHLIDVGTSSHNEEPRSMPVALSLGGISSPADS